MTLHDFDPDELDLLIDLLREQHPITASQSHKTQYAVLKLIVLLEDELQEDVT